MENKELIEAIKPIWENFGLTKEQYDDIVAPYQILLLEALKQQSGKFMMVDVNKIPEDFNEEEFLKIAKNQGLQIFQSEPTLEEAIKVLQKHLRKDKSESDGLKPQMLNSKKLEILKSIANSGGIDWDEVIENERIVSLQLKTF